jgi:virginiamycin B lyase
MLGQSPVSVVVTDNAGQMVTQTVNLSVINPKLALVCDFSAQATVGRPYLTTCQTYGGTPPYSYSGTLPPNLSINSIAQVSGTPTTAGASSFTVNVTDSTGLTAQQTVNLFVYPTALTILTTTLPVPSPPLPYFVQPLVDGGTPPYSFAILPGGALPGGVSLSKSGTISSTGTVTSGAYSFTLQVTDSKNDVATQAYSGTVAATSLVQDFASYALPSPGGGNGITVGSDGALWFTALNQPGGDLIGRITTAGAITSTPAANPLTMNNFPELPTGGDIVTGPDGELWIAQRDGNAVGEVALDFSSQLTYLPTTANSAPGHITAAPDGALWFTETAASKIAHVDAGGNLVELATPTPSSLPYGIAVGPDNSIWFTEPGANKIGYVTEDGKTSTDFTIPTANSLPTSIILGPDNAFWFTEFGAKKIGRFDPTTKVFQEVSVSSGPLAITVGPDDALYFTENAGNIIGRITLGGTLIELPIADAASGPTGIVAGPDGAIWFMESNLSKVGRLSFIFAPTVSCTLPASPQLAGSAFSGTCTASNGTPPYTFSATGLPPGVSLDSSTGILSGTLTIAGYFNFTVTVTDSSTPIEMGHEALAFTVTPLPLSLSCNTPTARLYTPYVGASQAPYGCTAMNGTPLDTNGTFSYTYALTGGTLPPGLSFDATTGNISGTPTTLGSYPFTVTVTDSSTPPMTAMQTITLSVAYGVITSKGTPLFTLSTSPLSVAPGSNAPGLTLSVNQTLLEAVTGSAVLTFTVDPALVGAGQNTPAHYMDPALQFVDASGNPLGITYNFSFQPTTTSITLPAIYPGTVLGTVNVTINASGLLQTGTSFPVSGGTPVIEPGSVEFTNISASGFDVEFVAMAPTRSAKAATITFNPSSGDQIAGETTFVFDVSSISNTWFSSAAGLQYGGRYSLTFSFVFNGSINAIGSATVSLDSSQSVTGNR